MVAPSLTPSAWAQCSYELDLRDSWGDGWNGNTIDVRVGSSTVNYTLSNGTDTTIILSVSTGDTIELFYNATGLYQSEVSFELFDANSSSLYLSGQAPPSGLNFDTTAVCPLCPAPSLVVLDSASSSSVSISWANTGAGSYGFEWGPCGFMTGTGNTGTSSTNSTTITGLAPSQCIDIYIYSDCSGSGNGTSSVVGPFSFTSLQPVIDSVPFFTNFEANNGFFQASGANASWQWGLPGGTTISAASSPSNAWVTNLTGDYNNSEFSFLTSSIFDLSNETADMILYFDIFYETENGYDEAWIELSTDGISWTKITDNGSAVNWYNDLGNQWWEATNSGWASSSIILDSIDGESTVQFRFVFSSDGSVSYEGVGIDDFGLAPLNCGVPSAYSTTYLTSDTAVINWTTSSGFSNYEYGPLGFAQGSGTLVLGATPSDTISGLTAGTTYQVYFQDSCGVGNIGIWVGPFTFTTQQGTISTFPYTEDFEATSGGWITSGSNNSWQWGAPSGSVITGAAQGSNAWVTNLSGPYNNSENSYLTSVIFDCSGNANDLQYTFSMQFETENNYDEGWVEYSFDGVNWTKLVDAGSAIGWYNDLGNQWWENTDGSTWMTRYNIIPGSAGQSYVQIRHAFSSDGSVTREGFGIDDVLIEPLTCAVPSALGVGNLAPFSADLYWTSTGNIWNIEWGPAGFAPGTGQGNLTTTTNDTLGITGLMANTCYEFYVQDSCAAGNSQWIGPYAFCTPPTCPAPTNLSATSVDSANATLVWDGNNLPGNYIIEYGVSGFQQGSGTMAAATADSLPITGLQNATTYCFYVLEICSPTDSSTWAGPYCFTTSCGSNVPGDAFANAIQVTGQTTYNGNTAVCYTNQVALRPSVDIVFEYTPSPGTTSATFATCGSNYDTYLYILSSSQATIQSNDDACGLQSTIAGLPVNDNDTYYVVIEGFSSGSNGLVTLNITEVNPCPAPTNLTSTAVTCTEVDLVWNSGSGSYAYQVEYGPQGFNPGSGTTIISNDTTELISGLSAQTSYDFYVRGFCTADTSGWDGPYNVSTAQAVGPVISATASVTNYGLTSADVFLDASNTVADSIYWVYGDTAVLGVSGATATVQYYFNGTWPIIVTAFNDCGSTTDTIYLMTTSIGISEVVLHSFELYPNPTTGVINLNFEDAKGSEAQIDVTDLQGRVITSIQVDLTDGTRDLQMDLSRLPKGVYLVKFEAEQSYALRRVVLQ